MFFFFSSGEVSDHLICHISWLDTSPEEKKHFVLKIARAFSGKVSGAAWSFLCFSVGIRHSDFEDHLF